ncbi:MAG: hypothetical protein AMXMBFR84_28740 [Candidatus Hydrogenedentota bacterium]
MDDIPKRCSIRSALANAGVSIVATIVGLAVIEAGLRYKFGPFAYVPRPEVAAVQEHLQLQPLIGYTWKPDIKAEQEIVFHIADAVLPPLSTDSLGFINAPEAIAERREGIQVDVLGLGDSFMEGASHTFHKRLREAGMTYYSFAIHRQSPPQYTVAFRQWGRKLAPRYVVYGLFENDFMETRDFYAWRQSDLDWFTYHSGTWCGPPVEVSSSKRILTNIVPGMYLAFGSLRNNWAQNGLASAGPSEADMHRVADAIETAYAAIHDIETHMILLLIPSKQSILKVPTAEWFAYDEVIKRLEAPKVTVLDLRPVFRDAPNPAGLFYVKDGHWNEAGIELAADHLLETIQLLETGANTATAVVNGIR